MTKSICPDTKRARSACVLMTLVMLIPLTQARSQSPVPAATPSEKQAHTQRQTVSGDLWVEPATLRSLGFEWRIAGDDNRNAVVQVSYRRKDEAAWHKALPLFRLQNESVSGGLPRDGDRSEAHV